MLNLIDAHRYPEKINDILNKISSNEMCFFIERGRQINPYSIKKLAPSDAEALISRFNSQEIFRTGASRGGVMPPFFSGKIEGKGVVLTDFIIYPPHSDGIFTPSINDSVSHAVLSLLFGKAKFSWVRAPIELEPWKFDGVAIEKIQGGLIFKNQE